MTNEAIFKLAIKAGFDRYDGSGLSGRSDLDRECVICEYPVGEEVLKFARLIERAVRKEIGAVKK